MHVEDLGRPLFIDGAIISRDFSFAIISKALQLLNTKMRLLYHSCTLWQRPLDYSQASVRGYNRNSLLALAE